MSLVGVGATDLPTGVGVTTVTPKPITNTTKAKTNNNAVNGKPKLDPSDPRVRKLVYSMYREMLSTCNDEANNFISQKDPARVKQDLGVGPILETIIRQGSQQGSSTPSTPAPSNNSTPSTSVAAAGGMPPPPPPPPMAPVGAIPAVRLNSEIGPRDKGPPLALANAMMKDKKPFTYTPGGIDLSEIRSPRMAKRIQMNAAAEGITSTPETRPAHAPTANGPPPGYLPPAAVAAMQPQMAIPVFPQGGFNPAQLNKTHKPSDFAPPINPPPPPFLQQLQQNMYQNRQQSPPPAKTPPPPPERSSIPVTMQMQFESRPVSNNNGRLNDSVDSRSSPTPMIPGTGVGTGCIYIPPIQNQSQSAPTGAPPPPPSSGLTQTQRPIQTKAQAHSQNLGSIYIPPIEQRPSDRNPGTASSSSSSNAPESPSARGVSSQSQSQSSTPMTPQLNKAPTPWMNSYNRIQNQPLMSPPYVNPANIAPWGVVGGVRTIPISVARDVEDDNSVENAAENNNVSNNARPIGQSNNTARVIPIQIQREESQQSGARNIPIQFEGSNRKPPTPGNQTPTTPQSASANPAFQKRMMPNPYNNPMGLYSNHNVTDAYHKQAGEHLGGVLAEKMAMGEREPIQSKSLRVIQKVAEDELLRVELQQQHQRLLEFTGEDKQLMELFKAQVDDGSLHKGEEPRFRGGHIPSRAFRALQSNLPPSPGVQDQPVSKKDSKDYQYNYQSYPTQAQSGQGTATHNIQIRMTTQSPTPHQQTYQHQIHIQSDSPITVGGNQARLPPSQQTVPEPKKYMGSNIPSRSFKILQAMTADDEASALGSEAAPADQTQNLYSSDPNHPESYSESHSEPNSSESSYDELAGSTPSSDQGYSPWQENYECDPSWDPYAYMSWYYWWYYTSCYWSGYDMTGYEYPQNWDPNYIPPEFYNYAGYENGAYDESYSNLSSENVPMHSKSFKNLQKGYEDTQEEVPIKIIPPEDGNPDVPTIIIQGENTKTLNSNMTVNANKYLKTPDSKMYNCDSDKNVVKENGKEESDEESSEDEDEKESCEQGQTVIKCETGADSNKRTEANNDDEEEDEETESEDDYEETAEILGIVEEPETPSSEDSDATLVDESFGGFSRVGNLTIEEYQSPNSESSESIILGFNRKTKLSTIDELTEMDRSRASSSLTRNLSQELEHDPYPVKEEVDESDEDSDSESEDELSSVSVIENKSDTQGEITTATESKREDETTSSDDGEEVEEDESNQVTSAVTVRLPLKLCFTKSKSYRDITTVLVGDSEIQKNCTSEDYDVADEEADIKYGSQVIAVHEITQEEDTENPNEPAVSYTISLSRQTSKSKDEDEKKNHIQDKREAEKYEIKDNEFNEVEVPTIEVEVPAIEVEEPEDIDFWSQIKDSEAEKSQVFWKTMETTESKKSDDFWASNETSEYVAADDYWGQITAAAKDKTDSDKEVEDIWANKEAVVSCNEAKESNWDTKDSIDYKWEKEFNFWDKSYKSFESRRFSNFEISEAYESDSGLMSDIKHERMQLKRHSIPGSFWSPNGDKDEDEEEGSKSCKETMKEYEECKDSPPWSYWDEIDKERESKKATQTCEWEKREDEKKQEEKEESSSEEEESEDDDEDEENNKDISVEVEMPKKEKSTHSESDSEGEGEEEGEDGDEREESENESDNKQGAKKSENCIEVEESCLGTKSRKTPNGCTQSDTELNSLVAPVPVSVSVSDENSDESSSKSSGSTIGRDKSEPEKTMGETEGEAEEGEREFDPKLSQSLKANHKHLSAENRQEREVESDPRHVVRPIEIREIREKIKLDPSTELENHETCTCHLADRMARAESLLWRIERFLQESLSLGSEDDSGVMTDLSRQISDVDTDADNDINDNEFLLTAAFAAKQKRSSSTGRKANNSTGNSPTATTQPATSTQTKKRPTSEILVETHSKAETEIETDTVKVRSASERKALRYQRAKTHSRLFQLLQDECSKEDDDDDDDDEDEEFEYESETAITTENVPVEKTIQIETEDGSATAETPSDTNPETRRSRLVPLPIKNFLTSSLSCDSNSSPSGSSGVLSPTSPVNRDQLLADIINEFHLRHQQNSSRIQQSQRRLTNFPSKIFQLLQQEFGEEFYHTFDGCADEFFQIPVQIDGDNTSTIVQECTIHKSESLKQLEAAALKKENSKKSSHHHHHHCRKSTTAKNYKASSRIATETTELTVVTTSATTNDSKTPEFLEVPLRKKKANMNRDPRSPKPKNL